MRRSILLSAAASLLLTPAWSAGQAIVDELQPAPSSQPTPPRTKEGDVNVHYFGTVTEVNAVSITVQWPGEAPKRFLASQTLLAGEYPKSVRPSRPGRQPRATLPKYRYRLKDVKVGDHVMIYFSHLGEGEVCDQICIGKRPGGLVPPLPDGAEMLKTPTGKVLVPYHELRNALWDLEDRGIPYPEKFGELRRWPIAPMPRPKSATN